MPEKDDLTSFERSLIGILLQIRASGELSEFECQEDAKVVAYAMGMKWIEFLFRESPEIRRFNITNAGRAKLDDLIDKDNSNWQPQPPAPLPCAPEEAW